MIMTEKRDNNGDNYGIILLMGIIGILWLISKIWIEYEYYENKHEVILKSYDLPYLPEKLRLKDKDNKMVRHLKIRYIYTCSENKFKAIKRYSKNVNKNLGNVVELFKFNDKNGKIKICFFVVYDEKIKLRNSKTIKCYPYKMYDTYVLGETRVFDKLSDIVKWQYRDRKKYGKKCGSTTDLKETKQREHTIS